MPPKLRNLLCFLNFLSGICHIFILLSFPYPRECCFLHSLLPIQCARCGVQCAVGCAVRNPQTDLCDWARNLPETRKGREANLDVRTDAAGGLVQERKHRPVVHARKATLPPLPSENARSFGDVALRNRGFLRTQGSGPTHPRPGGVGETPPGHRNLCPIKPVFPTQLPEQCFVICPFAIWCPICVPLSKRVRCPTCVGEVLSTGRTLTN